MIDDSILQAELVAEGFRRVPGSMMIYEKGHEVAFASWGKIVRGARTDKLYAHPPWFGNTQKAPTSGGACAKVWEICDQMSGEDKDAVIQACVESGVNESTAKTQFAKWRKQSAKSN